MFFPSFPVSLFLNNGKQGGSMWQSSETHRGRAGVETDLKDVETIQRRENDLVCLP